MFLFLIAVLCLILGYVIYGKFVQKVFGVSSENQTPAIKCADNVDYVAMHPIKIFLIQFLNIAGLGPVFGAVLGAIYGPAALLWIVLGSIFAGAVHDYTAAMISVRNDGRSLVSIMQKSFGKYFNFGFMIFLTFFLLLVGAVFAMAPARMLADITTSPFIYWIIAIFLYYFFATLLPIDKIIGRFYPFFALILLLVTVCLLCKLFISGVNFYPNLSLRSQNPNGTPIFPLMFITIACGALSGFHATQSPMMARCITNEYQARPIFYGAMILEGFIALVWATLGIAFYQNSAALSSAIAAGGPGAVVSAISKTYLGEVGSILTVISVVVLSITSGDTAFRSARLNLSDCFNISQSKFSRRILLSVFVLSGGIVLSMFDLTTIWSYFGWANQILASLTLWFCTMYLYKNNKFYYITLIPAIFITSVCVAWGIHLIKTFI